MTRGQNNHDIYDTCHYAWTDGVTKDIRQYGEVVCAKLIENTMQIYINEVENEL